MKPSELFKPDRGDIERYIEKTKGQSRQMGDRFEEAIRETPDAKTQTALKKASRLPARRSQEGIEKALRTWESGDIDATLRVMHPNLG